MKRQIQFCKSNSISELAPGSISSVVLTESQITARWTPVDGDVDGYILTCVSAEHSINVTLTSNLNATCDDLTPGTEYNITVTSVKDDLESVESPAVTVKTSECLPSSIRSPTFNELFLCQLLFTLCLYFSDVCLLVYDLSGGNLRTFLAMTFDVDIRLEFTYVCLQLAGRDESF